MSRLLVVEDDDALRKALAINLRVRGYDVEVASDAGSTLRSATRATFDVVVLDLGLPDMSGLTVITGLRGWTSVPIIVLSARDPSATRSTPWTQVPTTTSPSRSGWTSCWRGSVRPCERAEPVGSAQPLIELGDLTIDLAPKPVRRSGAEVRLTPTEWHLLEVLARQPGKLIGHQELLEKVWGPAYRSETHYLRVYMAQLRRKLEARPAQPRLLITEPGLGYRFETGDGAHVDP